MTEKEKLEKIFGFFGEAAIVDDELQDHINKRLDLTLRQDLENRIREAIDQLRNTPEEILNMKISDYIIYEYNKM